MSILIELNDLLTRLSVPVETGIFTGTPPDVYIVITPLSDNFGMYADNRPQVDVQEVRLSLFSKNNYISLKNQLVRLLLQADFCITDRKYIGFETETKYFHLAIDVAKHYEMEE